MNLKNNALKICVLDISKIEASKMALSQELSCCIFGQTTVQFVISYFLFSTLRVVANLDKR